MTLFIDFEYYLQEYKSKQLALFHALREAIINGKVKSHDQLPPTRVLAQQFQLSRGTVNYAYDMLAAQGLIYTIGGSGCFVSEYNVPSLSQEVSSQPIVLSKWGKRVTANPSLATYINRFHLHQQAHTQRLTPISFQLNRVNLTDFPLQQWNKVMYEQTRLQYDDEQTTSITTAGDPTLQQAIANHLSQHRGIHVDAAQIVVVNGSQQALSLLAHLLIDEGDTIAMENPHYTGMRMTVEAVGGQVDAYNVDEHGIQLALKDKPYKLLYLTPNRQFPTGVILSMERRQALLKWASAHHCFIIEDDYDSEFTYTNRALEPLKSLDYNDQVIYVGTFSRTMMQHIRLGYVVLPKQLTEAFIKAKMLFERHPSSLIQQRALASFMEQGYYDRHLRRIRRLYKERALVLRSLLQQNLSHLLDVHPLQAGLHLFVDWLGDPLLFEPFIKECRLLNVFITSATYMYSHDAKLALCLGFAHLTLEEIEEGVNRLVTAYSNVTA